MDPHKQEHFLVSVAFFMAESNEYHNCPWARYYDGFLGLYCMGGEL